MNILFILPEYYPHTGGGICTYYKHYINAIKPQCNKIRVLVGSAYTQSNQQFDHDGVEVNYLDPIIYQRYVKRFSKYDLFPEFRNSLASAWAMWEQADQGNGFDLVECTDFGLGFVPWIIDHRKPVATRLHGSAGQISLYEKGANGMQDDLFRNAELQLLRLSDLLITHSPANKAFWESQLTQKLVHGIYPAFEGSTQPLPLNAREPYGLVTARIQQWKGPVQLCKALSLLDNSPAIRWIGRDMPFEGASGTQQFLLKKFPAIWGKRVIALPSIPNAEITALQQKAKFGLVPSTWDMFNFTCLEFMAAGTPVICSDGAGVSALIEHGKNGFKYPADDAEALARCIQTVDSLSAEAYTQIAKAGRDTITSLFSTQQIAGDNFKIYVEMVEHFEPGSSSIYLDAIYKPSDQQYTIDALLDKQPLKLLTRYYTKRISKKLKGDN